MNICAMKHEKVECRRISTITSIDIEAGKESVDVNLSIRKGEDTTAARQEIAVITQKVKQ